MNVHLQEWGKAILQAAVIIVILFFFCWPMRISGQLHGIDHEGWGNRADEPLCDDAGKI